MTKAELLADLATIYHAIMTPILDSQNSEGDWNFYKVKVLDKLSDTGITDSVIGFRVYKEGEAEEEAYYVPRQPTPQSTLSDFGQEVQDRLNTIIQNNVLDVKAGWIVRVDTQNERADITVQRGDPDITEQYAIVYRKADLSLDFFWYTKP